MAGRFGNGCLGLDCNEAGAGAADVGDIINKAFQSGSGGIGDSKGSDSSESVRVVGEVELEFEESDAR